MLELCSEASAPETPLRRYREFLAEEYNASQYRTLSGQLSFAMRLDATPLNAYPSTRRKMKVMPFGLSNPLNAKFMADREHVQ